jgi:2-polyprenyl-3-methyl-5-hydroxy-6-metoxy-1,4-benzoquinol methylase
LRPSLAPRSRVLEIGSGIGCNVMNFALAGFDASGVEPGAGFSAFSREKMQAQVQSCTLEDLPASGDYDVVLLVHVLEHLPHPTRALRQIAGLLRPQGKLYVEVPNFGLPHAAPGKQFHYAHIYNFTIQTLQMLTAKTGFRVERTISRPHERVLGLLLTKTDAPRIAIDTTSYAHTLRAAGKYSRWSYYLRSRYLIERVGIGLTRLSERYMAQRQMQGILDRCQRYAERREPKRRLENALSRIAQLQHA